MKDARLAHVNRLRTELGLAPLTAQQIAHDRSLAEPDRLGPLRHEPVVDSFDLALEEGRR